VTREELDVTRWRGFSHTELYQQLHTGPGATAAAGGGAARAGAGGPPALESHQIKNVR
jgi:hypothetical protein